MGRGKNLSSLKAYESITGWYWFATEIAGQQDSVIDIKVYKNDTK
jgi:hypothetical protein